jgi:hypothetical protein
MRIPLLSGFLRQISGEQDDLPRLGKSIPPSPEKFVEADRNDTAQKSMRTFFGLASSRRDIGWMKADPATQPGPDVTAEFERFYAAAVRGEDVLPKEAKDWVFLCIPGTMSKHFSNYFEPNEKWLQAQGMTVAHCRTDSEGSNRDNAEVIAGAIRQIAGTGKKVFFPTHSRGSPDVQLALATYPDLKQHVIGHAALQPADGGSPIGSDANNTPMLKKASRAVLDIVFGGHPGLINDLSHSGRKAITKKHPPTDDVPTVSLSSYVAAAKASVFAPTNAYMTLRYQAPNDGMLALDDAYVPKAPRVILKGVDHLGTVMEDGLGVVTGGYQAGPLTGAMVRLVWEEKLRKDAERA